MKEKNKKRNDQLDHFINTIVRFFNVLKSVTMEIFYGISRKTIPFTNCVAVGLVFIFLILIHADTILLRVFGLGRFYLRNRFSFYSYLTFWFLAGFYGWGFIRLKKVNRITKKLTDIFHGIDLKNKSGQVPDFISDLPVDEVNRVLKLKSNYLSKEEFKARQTTLASSLQVYVEDIEENRTEGTVSILYSTIPMPDHWKINDVVGYTNFGFPVGKTRAKTVTTSLLKTPHMLVAGETDGGKSTFLRSLITTIYMNNKTAEFLLADLKGNLEFSLFENLPRIKVCGASKVYEDIRSVSNDIRSRFSELSSAGAKDLEEYDLIREKGLKDESGKEVKLKQISRYLIVVDEISVLFLTNDKNTSADVKEARAVLSQISRQGRAVGIHLILATQRPDANALDPQIKSNLGMILAYKIPNEASSRVILDNNRAAELPDIVGRAIWKRGGKMIEVQTPFLDKPDAERILKGFRKKDSQNIKDTAESQNELGDNDDGASMPQLGGGH